MLVRKLKDLGFVVAQCKCGHLQGEHSSLLIPLGDGKSYREYHAGGCVECSCKQFTFHRFVTLEEAAEIMQGVGV